MNVKTLLLALTAALSLAAFSGCDDGGDTTNTGGNGGTGNTGNTGGGDGGNGGNGGNGGSTNPPPPTLGAQIDRMGRPAINTATNHVFNKANPEQKDQAKDSWNENSDPATWNQFGTEIQKNLAILDSLDTMCGNQLLADTTKTDPSRYGPLAGVLADDRLYLNTAGTACTKYLAVETGMANDCGGRTLAYDVIDVSYTLLATGALDGAVGDDVPISSAAQGETFPHLIAPN